MHDIGLPVEDKIWQGLTRKRAYAAWEREGRPRGRERAIWLEAETELRGDLIRQAACTLRKQASPAPSERDRQAESEAWGNLIRQRAYALWKQEGRPSGRERANWLEAEIELCGDLIRGAAGALEQAGARTERDSEEANSAVWGDLISKRAYAVWEQEGRPRGRDLDNWLQAEDEVIAVRFANWPERLGTPSVVRQVLK